MLSLRVCLSGLFLTKRHRGTIYYYDDDDDVYSICEVLRCKSRDLDSCAYNIHKRFCIFCFYSSFVLAVVIKTGTESSYVFISCVLLYINMSTVHTIIINRSLSPGSIECTQTRINHIIYYVRTGHNIITIWKRYGYEKSGYLRENCFKLERFVPERILLLLLSLFIYVSFSDSKKWNCVFQQKIFRYHICKQCAWLWIIMLDYWTIYYLLQCI